MSQKKETWSREAGYIWSMIGSAVGFANVLSFSALCYKNGGGAFLIPYLVAHLLVGIPMLMLEGFAGQRTQLPLVGALGSIGKSVGRTLGWLSILTCLTIGGFYTVLTGFSVAYAYFTAVQPLPTDTAAFFKEEFLLDSGSLSSLGSLSPIILISTLVVIALSWIVLSRQIQSGIERVCSLFMPLLGVLVLLFALVSCFLPGASEGFIRYLVPDFSKLVDWALWRDVFGQVFFSLSLGLGIVVGYSRHNPKNFNIPRAMVSVAIGDFLISLISGFAIFGGIGYMSQKTGIAFDALVPSDSAFEIGFVIFPMILSSLGPLARLIGPLFFACVFIAGITGVFSIVESIAGNIEVEFKRSRKRSVAIAMVATTLLALFFCFGNGQHLIGALAPMVLGNAMLLGGIAELVLFLFFSKVIGRELAHSGSMRMAYLALKWAVLPLLLFSLGLSLYNEAISTLTGAHAVRWGWFAAALALGILLSARKKAMEKRELTLEKQSFASPAELDASHR